MLGVGSSSNRCGTMVILMTIVCSSEVLGSSHRLSTGVKFFAVVDNPSSNPSSINSSILFALPTSNKSKSAFGHRRCYL